MMIYVLNRGTQTLALTHFSHTIEDIEDASVEATRIKHPPFVETPKAKWGAQWNESLNPKEKKTTKLPRKLMLMKTIPEILEKTTIIHHKKNPKNQETLKKHHREKNP